MGGAAADLQAAAEAAYIAGHRTSLAGVPRRPASPAGLAAIAEAEEPPAGTARARRRGPPPAADRPPARAPPPRPRARPPAAAAYEAGLSAPPLEIDRPGGRPRSPEFVALEHVGVGGAFYDAEPADDRDLPWYAALTSCTGCTGYY